MKYVGTHEREHRHDVVQDRLWGNMGEAGNKQQSLMEGLWALGS